MWRNKKTPARVPHPDPARELELQRILDLRASVGRRADLIGQYCSEIGHLHKRARDTSSHKEAERCLAETKVLHDRISETEDAIAATGEQIAALTAAMSPDDLAYLS